MGENSKLGLGALAALARGAGIKKSHLAKLLARVRPIAGFLPDSLLYSLPVTKTFTVCAGKHRFNYSLVPEDDLGAVLFWRGVDHYDAAACLFFARLAVNWKHVIDVGANTGFYTLLALAVNPDVQVLSLEPVPRLYERLVAMLNQNAFDSRCEARMEAVSDFCGTAELHIPDGGSLMASLNPDGHRGLSGHKISAKVTTLDAVWPASRPLDFVKIDTEGFEDKVLMGMGEILSNQKPLLMIECLPDGPIAEVERILCRHKYTFIQVCANELRCRESIVVDVTRAHPDYLAVPPGTDPDALIAASQT